MQPTYITISKLFSNDERFTVPLFQRPYVWSREGQWEPLWDDVQGVLGRLAGRKGDEVVACHFLGTIVLEQMPNRTGTLPRREVIDGQQRLTTLQILLKAAGHALEELAAAAASSIIIAQAKERITRLTQNLASDQERYKVWPTNEDREPFRAVLDADVVNGLNATQGRMAEAYCFFKDAIKTYLASGVPEEVAPRLAEAVREYLKIIVLDLDTGDEPQAIFETLNAHGTPLLPADLMKNWLLWEATRQKIDPAPLYEKHWRQFDREHSYWRFTTGAGHAARPRVDTFLQNWLTRETQDAVPAKHLYDRFLRHAETLRAKASPNTLDIGQLMAGIHADAGRFELIDKPQGKDRFSIFLQRLKSLDVSVFHPLLLLMMEKGAASSKDLGAAAEALESYLVRRMVCGMQTRSYGTLALRLLSTAYDAPAGALADSLRTELLALTGTDEWPDDAVFQNDWMTRRFYQQMRRERILMILQAIELHLQAGDKKAEPLMTFDWSKLQIEHVMPRKWETHWPQPEGIEPGLRRIAVDGIGNLTLLSGSLNGTMSNAAWTGEKGKRSLLNQHSNLRLNRDILDHHADKWDEDAISERAARLFGLARNIWSK